MQKVQIYIFYIRHQMTQLLILYIFEVVIQQYISVHCSSQFVDENTYHLEVRTHRATAI